MASGNGIQTLPGLHMNDCICALDDHMHIYVHSCTRVANKSSILLKLWHLCTVVSADHSNRHGLASRVTIPKMSRDTETIFPDDLPRTRFRPKYDQTDFQHTEGIQLIAQVQQAGAYKRASTRSALLSPLSVRGSSADLSSHETSDP